MGEELLFWHIRKSSPSCWDRRGLWHIERLEHNIWSLLVHLDLIVGVRVLGACTGPGESAESDHHSRQVT